MGHQESSPPRQRHRVPHQRHRPRSRHHRTHPAAAQAANRDSALSLGRLNREAHVPDSHAVVESWLGGVTAPALTRRLVYPEARNRRARHRKPSHSQDRLKSPRRQSSRRIDRSWRPQHIPPARGASPSHLPVPYTRERDRYNRNSDDSSLIADSNPLQGHYEWDTADPPSEHEENTRQGPLDESEAGTVDASLPASHNSRALAFEKRPRHKTKADKYDSKKSGKHTKRGQVLDQDEHRPSVSRLKKRKHTVTGKNIMNNFNSEAVLSDRITVQPNLKPGLFNNRRMPNKPPITDLAFSEMPFPTHHERDVPQQKGLSGVQLSERRRENRELEQISSFFVPARKGMVSLKVQPSETRGHEEVRSKLSAYRDNARSPPCRELFATPSTPSALTRGQSQLSSVFQGNPRTVPTATSSNPSCRPGSSVTTYFTWSTSQHSPPARRYIVDTQPSVIESSRSSTPADIREALVATGVYDGTGIRLSKDWQGHHFKERDEVHPTTVRHEDYGEEQTLVTKQKSKTNRSNDIRDVKAVLGDLAGRWNRILLPQWRRGMSISSRVVSPLGNEQRGEIGINKLKMGGPPNRQEIVKEARIGSIQEQPQAQHACHQGAHDCDANLPSMASSTVPVSLGSYPNLDNIPSGNQDRDKIASRDAMPPPPMPLSHIDSLHLADSELRDDLGPIKWVETDQPARTHVFHALEHPHGVDEHQATCRLDRVPEKLIPTLDSASWIPQAVTSNIANYERDRTLSRLSMKSPIYEGQGKEKNLGGSLPFLSPSATYTPESMAEFIARIESELEESTSSQEQCQQESVKENREHTSTQLESDYNSQDQRQATPNILQVDCRSVPTHVTRIDTYPENNGLAGSVGDIFAAMATSCSRDDDDEFLEMSRFWRPNPFSHF
ncbi:hypothetical protein F4802DRAFT_253928 [Xylaria palmicola]|nr:hypothetical protein F4802DRAFT_253928 [Xylaria palmicola]